MCVNNIIIQIKHKQQQNIDKMINRTREQLTNRVGEEGEGGN